MVTFASVGMLATGRRSDSEGGKEGRKKWRSDRAKLPNGGARFCVVLKPERARAEQSKQHGRRGAWRRGAERVLVPADRVNPGKELSQFAQSAGQFRCR